MSRKQREYLTAIDITGGIITLIEPDGTIGRYRQRGMQRAGAAKINQLVQAGIINPNWHMFKELPKNYSISFEDEDVQGRAYATFRIK